MSLRQIKVFFGIIACVFLFSYEPWAQGKIELPDQSLSFVKNEGQWTNPILFYARTKKSTVRFLDDGISYAYTRTAGNNAEGEEQFDLLVWNLQFKNALRKKLSCVGLKKTDTKIHYFNGSHTAVSPNSFERITYSNVYENINLTYYGSDSKLKYDFIVKPGGDVNDIILEGDGIKHVSINRIGQLEITTEWGVLLEDVPYAYQLIEGVEVPVDVQYDVISTREFGFRVIEGYNKNYDLIVDPLILEWSTFVTNTAASEDQYVRDIAVDNQRNVYGVGYCKVNFPVTPGVYDATFNGGLTDAIVFKLSPDGSRLLWSTYVGGDNFDQAMGIEVNDLGDPYVVGYTGSKNFPSTPGAFQRTFGGGNVDLMVFKLNSNGNMMAYSTYVGGNNHDRASDIFFSHGMGLTQNNEVVYAARSNSPDFPTTPSAYDRTNNGGMDAVVFKLNPTGTGMIYSTWVGGSGDDEPNEVEVDLAGNAYVCGTTTGAGNNFPITAGAVGSTSNGSQDGFIFKLNTTGTNLDYATYINGTDNRSDNVITLDVNDLGEVFAAGHTDSRKLPVTAGVFDPAGNGVLKSFVIRLSADATSFMYMSYLGGSLDETQVSGIQVSEDNLAFVVGSTMATDYPVTACSPFSSGIKGMEDGFLSVVNETGTALDLSFLFGGNSNDYKERIRLIEDCGIEEIRISLTSHSPDYPTTAGAFSNNKSSSDEHDAPVVMKITPKIEADFAASSPICQTVELTDMSRGQCIWKEGPWTPTSWNWEFGDGGVSTERNPKHFYASPGTYNVRLIVGCPRDTIIQQVTVSQESGVISLGPDTSACKGENILLDIGAQTGTILWSTGDNTSSINVDQPGEYWVTLSDGVNAGCPKTDTIQIDFSDPPSLSLKDTATCDASQGIVLDAENSGSKYLWSSGETSQTITITVAGEYWVRVGEGGSCSTTDTMVAAIGGNMNVELGSEITICDPNESVELDAGTGPDSYNWSNGETTSSINVSGVGKYWVDVSDVTGNCSATDTVTIVLSSIKSAFSPASTGCAPVTVQFSDLSLSNPDSIIGWYWDFGDGGTSTDQNPEHSFADPGTFDVQLVVVNTARCWDTLKQVGNVIVNPVPVAKFDLTPEETSISNATIEFTDHSLNSDNWSWQFGDGSASDLQDPGHTYSEAGTYIIKLFVNNEFGCEDSTLRNVIINPEWSFYVPNVFTPNNEDGNETFIGLGRGILDHAMWIYDRWGLMIYKTDDTETGEVIPWNGKHLGTNRAVQEDTYVYVIKIKNILQEEHEFIGHVTVLK